MMPIFSVIGHTKTGKTTIIRDIVRGLRSRDYKVAVIKHDPQDHGNVDREGSDTSVFFEEGSSAVVLSSASRLTIFRRVDEDTPPEDIIPLLGSVDCVILEGYKGWEYPKIEIWSAEKGEVKTNADLLMAIICHDVHEKSLLLTSRPKNISIFSIDELNNILDFIEEKVLRGSGKGGE
ncbi:MAG: molybdopterin-guanine dinucleotide biosynthesis protein B [Bacillota bacterium]|nr:molybdopterin-guanine dinucleotide biosynthesis protein B [Bacillota bacterium]